LSLGKDATGIACVNSDLNNWNGIKEMILKEEE
jgi:hypothetical protein